MLLLNRHSSNHPGPNQPDRFQPPRPPSPPAPPDWKLCFRIQFQVVPTLVFPDPTNTWSRTPLSSQHPIPSDPVPLTIPHGSLASQPPSVPIVMAPQVAPDSPTTGHNLAEMFHQQSQCRHCHLQ